MLGKLIKHELRATGRILLPALAVLLVLTVMAGFSIKSLEMSEVPELLEIVFVLILMAFVIGIIAVWVMTFWMMISRFYKNLLGDEGYLMFTLPASVHSHIWAKIIVSLLWFLFVGFVVAALIFGLMISLTVSDFAQLMRGFPEFREVWQFVCRAFDYNTGEMIIFALEFIAIVFFGAVGACLQFYAAMAVGQSFANHKLLFSVLVYVALSFGLSMLSSGVGFSVELAAYSSEALSFMWHLMHSTLVVSFASCALLYIITAFFLKKKLNLA